MKFLFLPLLIVFLFFQGALAQKFEVGTASGSELSMASYSADPTAHAVVLDEKGDANITTVTDDRIRLIYQYYVKVKIFDSEAFKEGTVEIPLYIGKEVEEEISDIAGTTMYADEFGNMKREELQPEKIYRVAENKNHTLVKFALPGLKKGCVIEYRYTITTPYFEDLHN